MAYLLDANVFIQAKNLHYGLDFCPAFWQWLIERNASGAVFSIEKVGDEIEAGQDDLSEWAGAPTHRGDSRDPVIVGQEDQDPECVHRSRRQVHDALRNASGGASAVCTWAVEPFAISK